MQGPDGVDRVQQYLPPDKVLHTQHADPDKKQKFSRAMEEEEEELERRRKQRPHDQVDLGTDTAPDQAGPEQEPTDGEAAATPAETAASGEETTEKIKHVDVKA